MLRFVPLFVATLLLTVLSPAQAQDCGPLIQVNTVAIAGTPTSPAVEVNINGTPKLFLLDTGGDITQIGTTTATELGLPLRESRIKMLDLYGHASTKIAIIDKFTLGHLTATHMGMAIEPDPHFGEGRPYVGIFAPDLMGRYDVEFDFAGHKMNYFSTEHCTGHVVYWPHQALAVTDMTFRRHHIILPVTLDGKTMKAEIDTGSFNTNISAKAARALFDITADTPGNIPITMPGMAGAAIHIFSTLDFDGVAVKNPHIVIRPDLVGSKDPGNRYSTGSHIDKIDDLDGEPDILIGMDVLKRLHLYVAFKEQRMYITEASGQVQPAASTAPTDKP